MFIYFSFNTSFSVSNAKSIIIIDARYDLSEALDLYREEITDAVRRSVRKRFRILIDGRKGFNVGYLSIPSFVRTLDVSAVIYVFRGRDVSSPIHVNLISLRRKHVVSKINQKLKIRG